MNKIRPVGWESHIKWECRIWSRRLWNSRLELLAHSSEKPMLRVPLEWECVVYTVDSYRGNESLYPNLLPVDPLSSGQLCFPWQASSTAHSLDFTGISRHRNAFVGAASCAALKGGPGVPWLYPQYPELILISIWDALMMLSLPRASAS